MRDFFGNFARFGGFFFFVLLEVICFVLIVRFNKNQRDIYLNSSNLFAGYVNKKYDQWSDYFHLTLVADSLARENARLLEELSNKEISVVIAADDTVHSQRDTILKSSFQLIPAKVINNSISKNHNFLTIDKGKLDNLEPHLGVVTDKGVVGIVRNVSPNYARVMSVLHRQMHISAALKNQKYFGSLVWKNNDPTRVTLEEIPKHAQPAVGDTVVTSGYSSIFPPGIFVGTVENYRVEPGNNAYTITVKLGEDIGKIQYVYVVRNLNVHQIKMLEEDLENE